jgi:Mitochondrial large subunit ribosomal protein (Img2)
VCTALALTRGRCRFLKRNQVRGKKKKPAEKGVCGPEFSGPSISLLSPGNLLPIVAMALASRRVVSRTSLARLVTPQVASSLGLVSAGDSSRPSSKPVQYPYFVDRTAVSQSLPVYSDLRNGASRYLTIVRRVTGDGDR